MDDPNDQEDRQTERPARGRVEGLLRFWLFASMVGFIVSMALAFLSFCFRTLNVLDTTPPLKTVPLPTWILMASFFVSTIVLGIIARKHG